MRRRKGQVIIFLAILLTILGLSIYILFLRTPNEESSKEIKLSDYLQDYGNTMLTTLLRSNTKNPLAGCETVKDVVAKAFYAPKNGKCCGISEYSCEDYAKIILKNKIDNIISHAKKNYVYYFEFGRKYSSNPILYAHPKSIDKIKECMCEKIVIEQKIIDPSKETISYPYAKLYIVNKDTLKENIPNIQIPKKYEYDMNEIPIPLTGN